MNAYQNIQRLPSRSSARSVLATYQQQRSTLQRRLRLTVLVLLCVALGLFYGFVWTLMPPQIFLFFLIPIGVLALFVIWALPDTDSAPTSWIATLLMAYLLGSILWPNYLAFQIPGLPWLSIRRIIGIPLLLIFLISYSTSPALRKSLHSVLASAKPMTIAVIGLTAIQFLTIFVSGNIAWVTSYTIKLWLEITALFFVSAWVFSDPAKLKQFTNLLLFAGVGLCLIGGIEWINKGVIWANYIPSFLAIQDTQLIDRLLSPKLRGGQYRVIGTYPVSLSLAECLAIVTPFVIHKIMTTIRLERIILWGIVDLLLLATIEVTQSRLGTLGWIVAHAAYGCVWAFRRWSRMKADLVAPALSLVFPVGVLLFFIGMFTIPAIRNKTIGGGATSGSDQSRLDQFSVMWPKLFRNPFGNGSGQSGGVLGYTDPSGLITVDSFVITVLLDYGVLGLILFATLLIYPTYKLLQIAWLSDDEQFNLALPLACALLIIIEVRLVLSQIDNLGLVYMIAGAAAAMLYRYRVATKDGVSLFQHRGLTLASG